MKLVEASGDISGKSPLRRGNETMENGRAGPECFLRLWARWSVWRSRLWTDISPGASRKLIFRKFDFY